VEGIKVKHRIVLDLTIVLACVLIRISSTAGTIENAVVAGDWKTVYENLETSTNLDPAVKAFLKDIACLNLDLECAPVVCTNALPQSRQFAAEEKWTRNLIDRHADTAVPQYLLAMVYARRGEFVQAMTLLNRSLELDSTFAPAYLQRGALNLLNGRFQSALSDYDRAAHYRPRWAMAFANRGGAYDALHQYETALADYDTAISLNPRQAEYYYNRGNTHRHMQDNRSAVADYTNAISRDSSFAAAYYNRGNAYVDLGRNEEAMRDYHKFLEVVPDEMKSAVPTVKAKIARLSGPVGIPQDTDATSLLDQGIMGFQQGNFDYALRKLNGAIELDSTLSDAYYYKAAVYSTMGNHPAAIENFTTVIRYNPNDTTAYYNRGLLYTYGNQYDNAIADFTSAIALNEKYALAYIARAEAYEKLEQVKLAIADYETFVKVCPDNLQEQCQRISDLISFLKSDSKVEGLSEAKSAIQTAYGAWQSMDWGAFADRVVPEDMNAFKEKCLPIIQITLPADQKRVYLGGEVWSVDSISHWSPETFFRFTMSGFSEPGSPFHDAVAVRLNEIVDVLARGTDRVQYHARVSFGPPEMRQEAVLEGFAVKQGRQWKIELPSLFTSIADMMSVAMDH